MTMQTSSGQAGNAVHAALQAMARQLETTGQFGAITVSATPAKTIRLEAAAKASAEPAFYRVEIGGDGTGQVSLVTAARYLSQSIEADLVHTGDKLDELLKDELLDQAYEGPALRVDHFRDDDKLFTFRSRLPAALASVAAIKQGDLLKIVLAYEACFRPLGDMEADDDE